MLFLVALFVTRQPLQKIYSDHHADKNTYKRANTQTAPKIYHNNTLLIVK